MSLAHEENNGETSSQRAVFTDIEKGEVCVMTPDLLFFLRNSCVPPTLIVP